MRNWNNCPERIRDTPYVLFSAYLWGIETISFCSSFILSREFSAYLWGIETRGTLRAAARHLCSQPTYEELKRPFRAGCLRWYPFSAYLWGIETLIAGAFCLQEFCSQPTYEELKPKWRPSEELSRGSSQPTYEELKHFARRRGILVLSLPMRNWNRYFKINGAARA